MGVIGYTFPAFVWFEMLAVHHKSRRQVDELKWLTRLCVFPSGLAIRGKQLCEINKTQENGDEGAGE